jgi:hypothetical protein
MSSSYDLASSGMGPRTSVIIADLARTSETIASTAARTAGEAASCRPTESGAPAACWLAIFSAAVVGDDVGVADVMESSLGASVGLSRAGRVFSDPRFGGQTGRPVQGHALLDRSGAGAQASPIGTGKAGDEDCEELAAFNQAGKVDPLVGRVQATSPNAQRVDAGKSLILEDVAVADTRRFPERHGLAEIGRHPSGRVGKELNAWCERLGGTVERPLDDNAREAIGCCVCGRLQCIDFASEFLAPIGIGEADVAPRLRVIRDGVRDLTSLDEGRR